MSSYKNHAIAGIIMAMPFIPSLFYLFFALLGASIPDMDHHNNLNKIYSMMVVGVVISILLYFINGSSLSGLIIVSLAIIFYLSKHRGFTHTFIGIFFLSFLFLLMIMGFLPIFSRLSLILGFNIPSSVLLFVILAIIGYFVVSRRILFTYLLILAVYLFVVPVDYLSLQWNMVYLMLLIGSLSHIILDLWTPAGLKVLVPFNNSTFYKKLGVSLLVIWLVISIYVLIYHGSFFTNFTPLLTYV